MYLRNKHIIWKCCIKSTNTYSYICWKKFVFYTSLYIKDNQGLDNFFFLEIKKICIMAYITKLKLYTGWQLCNFALIQILNCFSHSKSTSISSLFVLSFKWQITMIKSKKIHLNIEFEFLAAWSRWIGIWVGITGSCSPSLPVYYLESKVL